jgi:hypothetical protein
LSSWAERTCGNEAQNRLNYLRHMLAAREQHRPTWSSLERCRQAR